LLSLRQILSSSSEENEEETVLRKLRKRKVGEGIFPFCLRKHRTIQSKRQLDSVLHCDGLFEQKENSFWKKRISKKRIWKKRIWKKRILFGKREFGKREFFLEKEISFWKKRILFEKREFFLKKENSF
jgi:hypothetical protein